jgi:hypothetical protein
VRLNGGGGRFFDATLSRTDRKSLVKCAWDSWDVVALSPRGWFGYGAVRLDGGGGHLATTVACCEDGSSLGIGAAVLKR